MVQSVLCLMVRMGQGKDKMALVLVLVSRDRIDLGLTVQVVNRDMEEEMVLSSTEREDPKRDQMKRQEEIIKGLITEESRELLNYPHSLQYK
jgi:hypothetical protein